LALCLLGCGARTELLEPNPADASVSVHDAHHDVHEEAPPDAPDDVLPDVPSSPLCAVPDAGIAKTVCTNDAKVGIITSSMPSCYVDLVVHPGDQGFVDYACMNDPSTWALAKFPGGTFTGSVQGTMVDLCTGTTFPWSDGCTWASAQRITGDVASGTLLFTYEEQPISGTSCEPPCTAHGSISVQ
jgi:hypothetical protein